MGVFVSLKIEKCEVVPVPKCLFLLFGTLFLVEFQICQNTIIGFGPSLYHTNSLSLGVDQSKLPKKKNSEVR